MSTQQSAQQSAQQSTQQSATPGASSTAMAPAKTGTAATPHQPAPIVVRKDAGRALGQSALKGIRLPILRVVQAQSEVNDPKLQNLGKFYWIDNKEEFFDAVRFLPIRVQVVRNKWPEGTYNKDRKLECWSVDGEHGAEGAKYAGNACVDCPFRGKGCAESHVAVGVEMSRQTLGLLPLGSSNWLAGVFAADTVFRKKIVDIKTREVKGKIGRWYGFDLGKRTAATKEEEELVKSSIEEAMEAVVYSPDVTEDEGSHDQQGQQQSGGSQQGQQGQQQQGQAPSGQASKTLGLPTVTVEFVALEEPELRYSEAGRASCLLYGKAPVVERVPIVSQGTNAEALHEQVHAGATLSIVGHWQHLSIAGVVQNVFVLHSFTVTKQAAQQVAATVEGLDKFEDLPF